MDGSPRDPEGDEGAYVEELTYTIVKTGVWRYQDAVPVEVNILEIDVDYELEFKKFEYEEIGGITPRLNANGKQYIIFYGDISSLREEPFFCGCSLTFGGLTVDEALRKTAELWNPIEWK